MSDLSRVLQACQQSLLGYAIAQWDGYRPGAHHRLIANALHRVEKGELKRLMIMCPPRHGKSQLTSEFFPAWYAGKNPDHKIMHASYSQDLANDFGRKIRNQIDSDIWKAVFPGITLSGDSQAANRFHLDGMQGEYFATGVGGPATGRGAHLLLIDDPIKNREEAESELMRERIWDWYTGVAYTRLMPEGAIVVIQTRWHESDLAGRILEKHTDQGWEVLALPAIDDADQALWPEQYPLEALESIRAAIGPRDWEALYQQRPRPSGGGEFRREWLNYYGRVNPEPMNKLLLVDPASGKRKNNDYTSMWVVGLHSDRQYYILDMVRDRLNLSERAEAVFRLHRKWRPREVRYERYGMMADIEHLQSRMDVENYRFKVREVGGSLSKEDRIRRLVPLFEQGRVWFPHEMVRTGTDGVSRDLVQDFIEQEYLAFPVGRHDDMMDGLARLVEPGVQDPWPNDQDVSDANNIAVFQPFDAEIGY